jgi:hypothetical protein
MQRLLLTAILLTQLTTTTTITTTAAADQPSGKVWLATIAVENYTHLPPEHHLRYCCDDEQALFERLRDGNRLPLSQMLRLRCGMFTNKHRPTKENILRELPRFLSQAQPQDVVILSAALHSSLLNNPDDNPDDNPEPWLLPEDFSPHNPTATAIPFTWLRDALLQTRANRVIVLLDACHSGGINTRAGKPRNHSATHPNTTDSATQLIPATDRDFDLTLNARELQQEQQNIYVLTSCRGSETSIEADDIQHGLFSHWLLCGIDGAADNNSDATITMDELFEFVETRVRISAASYKTRSGEPCSQHPQRIFLGNNYQSIPLLGLTPLPLDTVIPRLAASIDSLVRCKLFNNTHAPSRKPRVLLCELKPEPGTQHEKLGFGTFPKILQSRLQESLLNRVAQLDANRQYQLIDLAALAINHRDIQIELLNHGQLPNTNPAEFPDFFIYGTVCRQGTPGSTTDPDRLALTLFIRAADGSLAGSLRTSIPVDTHFPSLFGGSFELHKTPQNTPQHSTPEIANSATHESAVPSPLLPFTLSPASQHSQQQLAQLTQQPHPQFTPQQALLAISLLQGPPNSKLTPTPWDPIDPTCPNLLSVPATEGHQLMLELQNQTDQHIAVVVQIDGLNQIGRNVAPPEQSPYWSVKPRAKWVVDQWMNQPPANPTNNTFSVSGGTLTFTSPPQSLAGRTKLSEKIGEIRISVFGTQIRSPHTRSNPLNPSLGIAESNQILQKTYTLNQSTTINPDAPLATYVIRYHQPGTRASRPHPLHPTSNAAVPPAPTSTLQPPINTPTKPNS